MKKNQHVISFYSVFNIIFRNVSHKYVQHMQARNNKETVSE